MRCNGLKNRRANVSEIRENPLLVSVRSGARASMPGMMDTILNLGLNDQTVQALVKMTGNERFAWDAYRRFVMMFSNVVLDVDKHIFEEQIAAAKKRLGVRDDTQLDAATWRALVDKFKAIVKEKTRARLSTRCARTTGPRHSGRL